jgi:hypothetical protein
MAGIFHFSTILSRILPVTDELILNKCVIPAECRPEHAKTASEPEKIWNRSKKQYKDD